MGDSYNSTGTLTDWHIWGETRCPDCFGHFDLDCSLEDLQRFTAVHDCPEAPEGGDMTPSYRPGRIRSGAGTPDP